MLHTGAKQPGRQGGERGQWGDGGTAMGLGQTGSTPEEQQRGLEHGGMKPSRLSQGLEGEAAHGMARGVTRARREPGDEWVGVQLLAHGAEEKKNAWQKDNGQRAKFSFLPGKCRVFKLSLLFH